ncbi:MAG TPA: rhomboid family intramembrane serine protease [Gemmatimonadales bacterium]|jgi:membrane associated rhomboid family serine protease|nr:rhomboid family intramembrane serine protease [Gemmatimonadales bacterium]
MFPYKDENPTLSVPVVTVAIIAVNVAVWVLVQGMGTDPTLQASVCDFGLMPGRLFGVIPAGARVPLSPEVACIVGSSPPWLTVLSSMFLHGGWLHLIGNMWFLWVFGNNVEDSTGKLRFLVFYLLCGVIAAATQSVANPESAIPMVGASGAISGVMGAYIVLYPRVRVHMLIFLGFFITTITVPAYLMLGYWFLLQLLGGLPSVARESGGVAFLAHAGGFVAGMVLVLLFRNRSLIAERIAHNLPA